MRAVCCLVLALFALTTPKAQAFIGPIKIGPTPGQAAGIIVGVGLIALPFYLIDRGVAEGCVAESDGKRALVGSDKKIYTLTDSAPSRPSASA